MKKRIEIEALLRWAYRDELPKEQETLGLSPAGFGGAWGGVERYGELLTVIDAPENRYGLVPDFSATTAPHPDAVRVAQAVDGLDTLAPEFPAEWNPLGDWVALGAEAGRVVQQAIEKGTYVDHSGARRLRTTASRLVIKHALLGDSPVWEGEEPECKVVRGANGKAKWFRRVLMVTEEGSMEVEVDGMDPRRRIPYPDAYQKTFYDPDPSDTVICRAEYEVWRAALDVLAIELEGELLAFEVQPCSRPFRPWEEGEAPQPRVLNSLSHPPQALRLWNGVWSVLKAT